MVKVKNKYKMSIQIKIKQMGEIMEEAGYQTIVLGTTVGSTGLLSGMPLKFISNLVPNLVSSEGVKNMVNFSKTMLIVTPVFGLSMLLVGKITKKLPDNLAKNIDYLAYC